MSDETTAALLVALERKWHYRYMGMPGEPEDFSDAVKEAADDFGDLIAALDATDEEEAAEREEAVTHADPMYIKPGDRAGLWIVGQMQTSSNRGVSEMIVTYIQGAPDPEPIASNAAAFIDEVKRGLRRDDDDPELYADLMEARERAEWAMGERDRIRQERDEALMERADALLERDDALADRDRAEWEGCTHHVMSDCPGLERRLVGPWHPVDGD